MQTGTDPHFSQIKLVYRTIPVLLLISGLNLATENAIAMATYWDKNI